MRECSNLLQKEYKTRNDEVRKVIHWELCKRRNFYHTRKWYVHNKESVLENGTYKILWDFEIQTDHQSPARRPDLGIINIKKKKQKKTRTCRLVDFAAPADHWVKIKEKENKTNLAWELRNLWKMRVTVIPVVTGVLGTVPKSLERGLEKFEIWGQSRQSKLQHCWERPEYWEESWRLEEICCHSDITESPSTNADVRNSKVIIYIYKVQDK